MANNQRKMMRNMSPGGGSPAHDAPLAKNGTYKGAKTGSSLSMKRVSRAAKKQIKTRESKSWKSDLMD